MLASAKLAAHTGEVIALSLDTWVSIAALAAVAITLFGQARSTRSELKRDIAELRAEIRDEIRAVDTNLRAELKHLDDRVYALAAGLKPEIERAADGRRLV